jgi:hypothetical protein
VEAIYSSETSGFGETSLLLLRVISFALLDNIRMDLGEVGWGDVDWIDLAKDRNKWRALVNSVLNLRVP